MFTYIGKAEIESNKQQKQNKNTYREKNKWIEYGKKKWMKKLFISFISVDTKVNKYLLNYEIGQRNWLTNVNLIVFDLRYKYRYLFNLKV